MTYRSSGLLVIFAVGLLAAPMATDAQQPAKVPRIGFLEAGSPSVNRHFANAFRQGLHDLGYVEGQNIIIEERWAEGKTERFPDLLGELIRLKVDVIVQASSPGALAAKRATATIPIVFVGVSDPVATGLVAGLARPGGNITGLSLAFSEGFAGKWVELIKEMVPRGSRFALLWNPDGGGIGASVKETQIAAAALGVRLRSFEVRDQNQLDGAFAAMTGRRLAGLIVVTDPLTLRHRTRIVELAAKSRLPAMYGFGEFVRAGGLIAYGPSVPDMFRRAATYVDKILKGAKPADLPVEQPTRFELVVNLKTAKALGLTIPQSIFIRADQVIQ